MQLLCIFRIILLELKFQGRQVLKLFELSNYYVITNFQFYNFFSVIPFNIKIILNVSSLVTHKIGLSICCNIDFQYGCLAFVSPGLYFISPACLSENIQKQVFDTAVYCFTYLLVLNRKHAHFFFLHCFSRSGWLSHHLQTGDFPMPWAYVC